MFIYKDKYESMKKELDYLRQQVDDYKTSEKILYTTNDSLRQKQEDLEADYRNTRINVRNAITLINKYDYRTMNIYEFLRDIKEELSATLERHQITQFKRTCE